MVDNNFVTIFYGLNRSGISELNLINHFKNPLIFLLKQSIILIPFLFMIFIIIKKLKFKINTSDKKTLFLISINLIPILLMLITSAFTGAKIRTMWMTPFYLFIGTLFLNILKKLK